MKVVCLISGGIDSPVAAYLMSRAGAEIAILHMDNRPYADDRTIAKVEKIAARLREVTGQEVPLYSAPHGPSQMKIHKSCDVHYQCVMCKRAMQRTAKMLAESIGAEAIAMGDSLGQVASQTMRNIVFENSGLEFPVLRPLIGFDKLEIEKIAREIGTYEISIIPSVGCGMVPPGPTTEADRDRVEAYDEACGMPALYEAAFKGIVRVS